MHKRGQTATEYLVILAIIIVIALVVVSVLSDSIGFGSDITATQSRATWATNPDVAVTDFVILQSGYGAITVRNNLRNNIIIESITLGEANQSNLNVVLPVGRTARIVVGGYTNKVTNAPVAAGDRYSLPLNITFVDMVTNAQISTNALNTPIVGVFSSSHLLDNP